MIKMMKNFAASPNTAVKQNVDATASNITLLWNYIQM